MVGGTGVLSRLKLRNIGAVSAVVEVVGVALESVVVSGLLDASVLVPLSVLGAVLVSVLDVGLVAPSLKGTCRLRLWLLASCCRAWA